MVDFRDVQPGTKLLVVSERCKGMNYEGLMDHWLGQVVTCEFKRALSICIVEDAGEYPYQEGGHWYWNANMFECIVDDNQADFEAPNFNESAFDVLTHCEHHLDEV